MTTEAEAQTKTLYRAYIQPAVGELIGTALFVLFVNLASAPSAVRTASYPLISGLSLFVMQRFFGSITPGHFNPAVSISLFLTRQFDVVSTATFVVVQLFGAFLGAVIFRALVSDVIFEDYFIGAYVITGDERDAITRSQGFFLEIILSAAVCFSYICVSRSDDNVTIPCCWVLVSFFSISLIGQSSNAALFVANAIVYNLFTGDSSSVVFLYLHISAACIAIALSSAGWWLVRPSTAVDEEGRTLETIKRSAQI